MTEAASKKKAASKKASATETERGRPREICVSDGAEVSERGHVSLYARNHCTIVGMGYIEMSVRVLRMPPGCFFLMQLGQDWIARGMKLHEQVISDECIVSMLVSSEYAIRVAEGERVGEMIPVASARLAIKKGE